LGCARGDFVFKDWFIRLLKESEIAELAVAASTPKSDVEKHT
jgi:hypothetical protein